AELHSRLVDALGALPHDAIAALRAAWQESRLACRAKFFERVGANPRFLTVAPVVLYRAIGDLLPKGFAEGASVWGLWQIAWQRAPTPLGRAAVGGHAGHH